MITLLRGGWIMAWEAGRHRVIPRGEVAFAGERLLYVGPQYPGRADVTLDRPEWLICPGLINLHAHIGVSPIAPFVDTPRAEFFAPSEAYVARAPLFLEPSLTPEEQALSAEYGLVQMLRSGTTTVVDAAGSGPVWWLGNPPGDEERLVEIVGRVGARAYLSLSYRSARIYGRPDGSRAYAEDEALGMAGLEAALDFAARYRGAHNGRVEALLCPHAADNCSPALLRATRAAARDAGLLVQIHTAQRTGEVAFIRSRYGTTPVGYLHSVDFLGPEIILGHCIYTSGHPDVGGDPQADIQLIAAAGSPVAHSPLPFAYHGAALYSFARYVDHGITVGIGCDLWPADIVAEMRLAWLLGKQVSGHSDRPSCMEIFTAATVGSADALQRPDLGRLAVGARADLVCFDLSAFHFGPILDPIRALISCGSGRDVDRVYVDGRLVVDGGRALYADEAALCAAAPAILQRQLAAATARDPLGRTATALLAEPARAP